MTQALVTGKLSRPPHAKQQLDKVSGDCCVCKEKHKHKRVCITDCRVYYNYLVFKRPSGRYLANGIKLA